MIRLFFLLNLVHLHVLEPRRELISHPFINNPHYLIDLRLMSEIVPRGIRVNQRLDIRARFGQELEGTIGLHQLIAAPLCDEEWCSQLVDLFGEVVRET